MMIHDEEVMSVLRHCAMTHVNRHVRAAGLQLFEIVCVVAAAVEGPSKTTLKHGTLLRETVLAVLETTLSDNWSQVRMAASVLARTLLCAIKDDRTSLLLAMPNLVPSLCLNRFYLAEGVKLYSQDTWKMILGDEGMDQVAANAGRVMRHYGKMCDADNHVVREAACLAVSELSVKLGTNPKYKESLSPFVQGMLQSLIMCFYDESWPVRDSACLACGSFVKAYPTECLPELETLFERWLDNLTDQIWSVREDAAIALGDAITAYGSVALSKVLPFVVSLVPAARSQPSETRLEKLARENDVKSHTNTVLYSCGSLAPKLNKNAHKSANRVAGCSDCQVTRDKCEWEATDGAIYMIRELCSFCDDKVLEPIIKELADVIRVNHFPQADELRATVWKQLPEMCTKLGKQRFKSLYLDLFLEELVKNLEKEESNSATPLSIAGAAHCCDALSAAIGKGIFRGRIVDALGERAATLVDGHIMRVAEARRQAARMPVVGVMPPPNAEQVKGLAMESGF